jgi:ribose 5-phosphate isomerase B
MQREGFFVTIAIGSDHGGFRLKKEIIAFLEEQGIAFRDFGTYSTDSVDYPCISQSVATAVASGEYERGIIICGTGIGVSIAANKVKGIRAALCHDVFSAQMSREHNDANILTMGERVIGPGLALAIVQKWLSSEFAGGRHANRVKLISEME